MENARQAKIKPLLKAVMKVYRHTTAFLAPFIGGAKDPTVFWNKERSRFLSKNPRFPRRRVRRAESWALVVISKFTRAAPGRA